MTALVEYIARSILDNENKDLTSQELEMKWQIEKNSSDLLERANSWLLKLQETRPVSAAMLNEGWLRPE